LKSDVPAAKPTVKKIIDAATRLFATKGFAAVSVKEIADTADVNVALISYYFGGKENLYVYLLEQQFVAVEEFIANLEQEKIGPVEKITRFALSMLAMKGKSPFAERLILREIVDPTECFETVAKKKIVRLHYFIRDCLREAVALGHFRPDLDPDYAAVTLSSAVRLHIFTQRYLGDILPERPDQAEYYARQALEIFLRGACSSRQIPNTCTDQGGKASGCQIPK